jgi:hypothetical protein
LASIVKKQFVQLEAQRSPSAGRGARAAAHAQKSVRALKVEGVVRALEVTCSCGETILVELEYPEAQP